MATAINSISIPARTNHNACIAIALSISSSEVVYLTTPSMVLFDFKGADILITCSPVSGIL